MDDKTQVALLFSVDELSNYNLKILAPQGVVIGNVSDDTTKFYSSSGDEIYENADEAVRKNNRFCFYYVKTVGDLKKKYKTDDIDELFESFLNDSYDKVYYYDNVGSDKFEDYFLKTCSINDFNKKFKLSFKYSTKSTIKKKSYDGIFGSIKDELENNLLFQDNARKQVVSTLYNNFLCNGDNSHIILSGPGGVGKTKLLKILTSSDKYPSLYVDFAPDDCESPRSYLNKILIDYYYVQLAMDKVGFPGVIVIDNIDSMDHDYDLYDFTEELKHIITTNKRVVPYSANSKTGVLLDTSKISFIICGKFNRAKECKEIPISIFESEKTDMSKIPVTIDKKDLSDNYGLSNKFLSLFNVNVHMKSLSFDEAKYIILNSPTSPLILHCQDLFDQGVSVNFSEETIDKICKLSYSSYTNLKKMDKVIKSVFSDTILNSCIKSGSNITINIDDFQYKKGFKK